jgi:hypothetical protein
VQVLLYGVIQNTDHEIIAAGCVGSVWRSVAGGRRLLSLVENIGLLLVAATECSNSRLRLKCNGTRAETRFRLSAERTSPFKSAGASVQSTTGNRGVCISGSNGSNAGYSMFRGSLKSTGYPLHSSLSPSLPLPCVTVCHHISAGLYTLTENVKHFE